MVNEGEYVDSKTNLLQLKINNFNRSVILPSPGTGDVYQNTVKEGEVVKVCTPLIKFKK
ncbi:hypothetical protein [Microaerobacter geothermalis]|uniref:hypothetical protein n=1 Tax=Microaerobacter geothermalis TaxID=674972 RepID=UPI001F230F13|nr:hypothetical protein [Microaerobacter geothermalis]